MSAGSVPTEFAHAHASSRPGVLRRSLAGAWTIFVAMVLCQSVATSVVVVGWTYRLMQRRAIDYWSRLGGQTRYRTPLPEWAFRKPVAGIWGAFWPLIENFKVGAQALLTTWTLTLPACALWQFGWYSGWDNSFNKGYEQSLVGAGIAWLGIVLFITAMLYLPVAQARHAVTGQWRAFFDFKTNRKIVKSSRFSCLLLALGYTAAGLPITFSMLAPYFVGNSYSALIAMPQSEQLAWLERFYFFTALPLFVLFVALRLAATRIYAAGVVGLLRARSLTVEDLRGAERQAFVDMALLDAFPTAETERPGLAVWASRGLGRFVAAALTVVLWFGLAGQTFAGQFLHYRPVRGWLNQPLIQAPTIRHIPSALEPRP